MPSLENPFLIAGRKVSFAMSRCLLQLSGKFILQQPTDCFNNGKVIFNFYYAQRKLLKVSPALPELH